MPGRWDDTEDLDRFTNADDDRPPNGIDDQSEDTVEDDAPEAHQVSMEADNNPTTVAGTVVGQSVREPTLTERKRAAGLSVGGRPPVHVYTEELGESLCEWIQRGGTITRWCEQHQTPIDKVMGWQRNVPGFAQRVSEARRQRTHTHVEQIIDMADDVTADPDVTVPQVKARELSSKYRVWLAGLLNRADYGQQDSRVGTNISFNIDLSGGTAAPLVASRTTQQQNNAQQQALSVGHPVVLPASRPRPPAPGPTLDRRPSPPAHEDS